MIQISNIKVKVEADEETLLRKAAKTLHIDPSAIKGWRIIKRSLDARHKPDLFYVYTLELITNLKNEGRLAGRPGVSMKKETAYQFPSSGSEKLTYPIAVIGSGPAGLFAAYQLAIHGYPVVIYERGGDVSERTRSVNRFWQEGILDISNNAQFGEGGAGTFSDGKLNTQVKDKEGRKDYILETFVRHGAMEDILYDQKPHIGTDYLIRILKSMRQRIEKAGGRYHFNSQVTGFEVKEGHLKSLEINHNETVPCEIAVLAIGHSARDTYHLLYDIGMEMMPKAFAVGVRIEHPQAMIDMAQYGRERGRFLPPSPYSLTHKASNGRGIYTFCMCPGGHVVNASSEPGHLCVNGMSYQKRDSDNANSALIVTVTPEDYISFENEKDHGVLAGLAFQRELERRSYEAAGGAIPYQLLEDFRQGRASRAEGDVHAVHCGLSALTRIDDLLPPFIRETLIEGIDAFGRSIKGFDRQDALLSGIEARTSSPVRLVRNEEMVSCIGGIYPAGEGAGYAGGITSAAIDGMKAAEKIAARFASVE